MHTLGQASAQDDNIVLRCDLVHDCGWMCVFTDGGVQMNLKENKGDVKVFTLSVL